MQRNRAGGPSVSKKARHDDMWGEELDDNAIEDCILRASQIDNVRL